MKVLFVLTSHSKLGSTKEKTGFWIEEFATPYYILSEAGVKITIASVKGGTPPIDPKSKLKPAQTPSTIRFSKDSELIDKLNHSLKLSDVNEKDYDAVFYPGGHGPLWDLANNKSSINLIESFYNSKKPIAFVCHSPAALVNVKSEDGEYLVKGKKLTGFSNSEEKEVGLTDVVPFSLEDKLKSNGAYYTKAGNSTSYVQHDGLLITGQNAASSKAVAKLLLKQLTKVTESFKYLKKFKNF